MIIQNPTINFGNITGSLSGTSSYAITASYAMNGVGGNTYTVNLPFGKGGGIITGTHTIPEGATILWTWIRIDDELSTTGAPFYFEISGSSSITLAEQGIHFNESQSNWIAFPIVGTGPYSGYTVPSEHSGPLRAVHSGAGYGTGIFYLQYSTNLS